MLDALGVDVVVRVDAGDAAGPVLAELVVGFRAIEDVVGQGGQADVVSGPGKTPQVTVVLADQAVAADVPKHSVSRGAAAAEMGLNAPPVAVQDPRKRRPEDLAQGVLRAAGGIDDPDRPRRPGFLLRRHERQVDRREAPHDPRIEGRHALGQRLRVDADQRGPRRYSSNIACDPRASAPAPGNCDDSARFGGSSNRLSSRS